MDESDNQVMHVKDVSEFLRLPSFTVRKLTREGIIPAKKVGKVWLYYKPTLIAWLTSKDDEALT